MLQKMILRKTSLAFFLGALLSIHASPPRSAVITLSLPADARALGMGEAGMAVSENAFATSWNPAALASAPLADEWRVSLPITSAGPFTSLVGKLQPGFLSKSEVWTAAGNQLWHLQSGKWTQDFSLLLQGRSFRAALRSYLGSDENLDTSLAIIRKYNNLEKNVNENLLGSVLIPLNLVTKDSITALHFDQLNGSLWVGTNKGLLRFDGQSWRRYKSELANRSILALAGQGSTLWVGTNDGLFRYSQQTWTRTGQAFAKAIKAPSDTASLTAKTDSIVKKDSLLTKNDSTKIDTNKSLTAIADSNKKVDSLHLGAIPTEAGSSIDVTKAGSQVFSALAWDERNGELWVGVQGVGLARLKSISTPSGNKDSWKLYNTVTDSVIDAYPQKIIIDDSSHVWVSHLSGISHFNRRKWSRIEFKGTEVHQISYGKQALWIATNKGMWRFEPAYFKPHDVIVGEDSTHNKDNIGEWEHFHQGTGMKSQKVQTVLVLGSEIWASTQAGLEHFDRADPQVGVFVEKLLPALNIPDLYHLNGAFVIPVGDWGTVGGFVNFVSFGTAQIASSDGSSTTATYNSTETVGALSYGLRLFNGNSIGMNFKLFYSDLLSGQPSATQNGNDATAFSYAFDVSYMSKDFIIPDLNLAFGLFNIGPSIYYVEKSKVDPIPLTWKVGIAYNIINLPEHRLLIAADYNRETISTSDNVPDAFYISAFKGWSDGPFEAEFNLGTEYTWDNLVALRMGYMYDRPGQREELSFGTGVYISEIIEADLGVIVKDLLGNGVRQGQWRTSFVFRF